MQIPDGSERINKMKVLSIGNSFSQDAHKYLHRLAAAEGVAMKCVNLYISGCTLRTHYLNVLDNNKAYSFEFNGQVTGIRVSIAEALASDNWDVITLQQASHLSKDYSTYTPYIEALAEYVRKYCPHAKLYIHETWAYEAGSARLASVGCETPAEMLLAVREAYANAASAVMADGIIPSGDAMLAAVEGGIAKIHRDTFHASRGAGRYLLALTWYRALTGNDIWNNRFDDLDEPVDEFEREIIIKAVTDTI